MSDHVKPVDIDLNREELWMPNDDFSSISLPAILYSQKLFLIYLIP
jgi:hypothetical protein